MKYLKVGATYDANIDLNVGWKLAQLSYTNVNLNVGPMLVQRWPIV